MYADRKGWDLEEVKLGIELERDDQENKTIISRSLESIGNLDEVRKNRLLAIANACPIHKILSNPIGINSQLI